MAGELFSFILQIQILTVRLLHEIQSFTDIPERKKEEHQNEKDSMNEMMA